jgi:preprotein translocase subunit SecF
MNIIKNRYVYFLISLLVIIPGIVFLILNWINLKTPLPLAIDFTGGSLLEVQYAGTRPSSEEVKSIFLEIAPDTAPTVQPLDEDSYAIRSKRIEDGIKGQIVAELETAGTTITVLTFRRQSIRCRRTCRGYCHLDGGGLLAYICMRFGVDHAVRYGAASPAMLLMF